jgi:hypothetical protein
MKCGGSTPLFLAVNNDSVSGNASQDDEKTKHFTNRYFGGE